MIDQCHAFSLSSKSSLLANTSGAVYAMHYAIVYIGTCGNTRRSLLGPALHAESMLELVGLWPIGEVETGSTSRFLSATAMMWQLAWNE